MFRYLRQKSGLFTVSLFTLGLTCSATSLATGGGHHGGGHHHKAAFVKCCGSGGTGTRQDPYRSLADAEDGSWRILKVLPAMSPLDGTIALKPGQQIQGLGPNPVKKLSSDPGCPDPDVPMAMLSSSSDKAVIESVGSNHISNLYIKEPHAAGIDLSLARYTSVRNVLICGHNQGERYIHEFYDFPEFSSTSGAPIAQGVPAIIAMPPLDETARPSGTIRVEHSRVQDGRAYGIVLFHRNSQAENAPRLKRSVRINHVDVLRINTLYNSSSAGLLVAAAGDNTYINADLKHITIEDITDEAEIVMDENNEPFERPANTNGIFVETAEIDGGSDGYQNFDLKLQNSEIRRVTAPEADLGVAFPLRVVLNNEATTDKSKVIVHNTVLENSTDGFYLEMSDSSNGKKVKLDFKDNTIQGIEVYDGIYVVQRSDSILDAKIKNNLFDNIADNAIAFVTLPASNNPQYGPQVIADIKGNDITNTGNGIRVQTLSGGMNFEKLAVKVEKNCFTNLGFGVLDLNSGNSEFGPHVGTLDLGGGTLGSNGHNAFVDNGNDIGVGEFAARDRTVITAKHNFWSGGEPTILEVGVVADIPFEPVLNSNPCLDD